MASPIDRLKGQDLMQGKLKGLISDQSPQLHTLKVVNTICLLRRLARRYNGSECLFLEHLLRSTRYLNFKLNFGLLNSLRCQQRSKQRIWKTLHGKKGNLRAQFASHINRGLLTPCLLFCRWLSAGDLTCCPRLFSIDS